jgi:hypothetical protein
MYPLFAWLGPLDRAARLGGAAVDAGRTSVTVETFQWGGSELVAMDRLPDLAVREPGASL